RGLLGRLTLRRAAVGRLAGERGARGAVAACRALGAVSGCAAGPTLALAAERPLVDGLGAVVLVLVARGLEGARIHPLRLVVLRRGRTPPPGGLFAPSGRLALRVSPGPLGLAHAWSPSSRWGDPGTHGRARHRKCP